MRVTISGAGIAGPMLAYWLARYGFQPTIVEKAPRLCTGGYIIDFWGAGFEIAERIGTAARDQPQGLHDPGAKDRRFVRQKRGVLPTQFLRYGRTLSQPSTRRPGGNNLLQD